MVQKKNWLCPLSYSSAKFMALKTGLFAHISIVFGLNIRFHAKQKRANRSSSFSSHIIFYLAHASTSACFSHWLLTYFSCSRPRAGAFFYNRRPWSCDCASGLALALGQLDGLEVRWKRAGSGMEWKWRWWWWLWRLHSAVVLTFVITERQSVKRRFNPLRVCWPPADRLLSPLIGLLTPAVSLIALHSIGLYFEMG